MKLEVLIADKLSPAAVNALEKLGALVTMQPDLSADDLPGAIGNAEVLVVRSTKVNRATIEAGKQLSLIVRAGAGVNTIDIQAASEFGIMTMRVRAEGSSSISSRRGQDVEAVSTAPRGSWVKMPGRQAVRAPRR